MTESSQSASFGGTLHHEIIITIQLSRSMIVITVMFYTSCLTRPLPCYYSYRMQSLMQLYQSERNNIIIPLPVNPHRSHTKPTHTFAWMISRLMTRGIATILYYDVSSAADDKTFDNCIAVDSQQSRPCVIRYYRPL